MSFGWPRCGSGPPPCYCRGSPLPRSSMPASLSAVPRVALALVFVATNTVLHCIPLFVLALVKLVLPVAVVRRGLSRMLAGIGESWIRINSFMMSRFAGTRIVVEGVEGLRHEGWYLVLCNHQSWVDIPVLQSVFNRRIPLLRFFLKSQLIWVPMLGLAWWALDFPFMKRYSREVVERRPELRGKDVEATRKACAKYRKLPVSVMNFVEGTRFTPAKHARQQSPFTHLLKPRAGGIALVLDAMGDMLEAIVDVSIVYPQGRPTVLDLMAGRVHEVRVHVRTLPIPAELLGGDYETDADYRERFQTWLNALWNAKDARIERI